MTRTRMTGFALAGLTVLAGLSIACAGATQHGAAPAAPDPDPVSTVSTKAQPAPPAPVGIGDGTYAVPADMKPGTYSATVPADSFACYWERESALDGAFASILANGTGKPGAHMTVTVKATDKGFKSDGCGTWTVK